MSRLAKRSHGARAITHTSVRCTRCTVEQVDTHDSATREAGALRGGDGGEFGNGINSEGARVGTPLAFSPVILTWRRSPPIQDGGVGWIESTHCTPRPSGLFRQGA